MFRIVTVVAAIAVSCSAAPDAAGQETRDLDAMIRSFEVNESVALLRADVSTLTRVWSDGLLVTTSGNQLLTRDEALDRVRHGTIAYSLFERYVDDLRVYGDTVLVVGSEAVMPAGDGPDAGRLIDRRFTHVWHRTPDGWRLAARHASVVAR